MARPATSDESLMYLLEEAATRAREILSSPTPPQSWQLYLSEIDVLEGMFDISLSVKPSDLYRKFPDLRHVLPRMVTHGINKLAIQLRNDEAGAREYIEELQDFLVELMVAGDADPAILPIALVGLGEHSKWLSREFIDAAAEWQESHSIEPAIQESSLDPEFFVQAMLEDLEQAFVEGVDEFVFFEVLQAQLTYLPSGGGEELCNVLLMSKHPAARNVVSLMLLGKDADLARNAAIRLVSEPVESLTQCTRERLVRIRNWVRPEVQGVLDSLIRKIQKKGLIQQSPNQEAKLERVFSSAVDGVGSQGILMMFKTGRKFRIAGLVLNDTAGIIDPFVSPKMTRKECEAILKSSREQTGSQECDSTLVERLLPGFIDKARQQGSIEPGLIGVLELFGRDCWQPQPIQPELWIDDLFKGMFPGREELETVLKNSASWTEELLLLETWFEGGAEARQKAKELKDECAESGELSSPAEKQVTSFCDELLEKRRDGWFERLARMALWCSVCKSDRISALARPFTVLAYSIQQSRSMSDIPLMRLVAEESLNAAWEDALFAEE